MKLRRRSSVCPNLGSINFLLTFFLLAGSIQLAVAAGHNQDIGPRTEAVDLSLYQEIRYVSQATGSDHMGDGSSAKPWKSIRNAMALIKDSSVTKRYAVLISAGTYSGETLIMKEYVDLYGGYDNSGMKRDIAEYVTVLDGQRERRVVVGANHAKIDGFTIRGGRFRGKGAGIICYGNSPVISNNTFTDNITLQPIPWEPSELHLVANDGGAIAALDHANPVVANNLIAQNYTEIGRGAGMVVDTFSSPEIINNVFLDNTASIGPDPMRSGDGGGISVYDWSDPVISNNLIIGNEAAARNDAGGVFIARWSAPVISDNVFVGNIGGDDAGGLFVGGQKHWYGQPYEPIPPADDFFVKVTGNVFMGNDNRSHNSGGMRVTMNTRGFFANNVFAENMGGPYIQDSDVLFMSNTVVDNFRYVNDKGDFTVVRYRNNILWGERDFLTDPSIIYCNIKGGYPAVGNMDVDPGFVDDAMEVKPKEAVYRPDKFYTEIKFEKGSLEPGSLVKRVVQAGDKWTVVRSNGKSSLTIWGDVSGQAVIHIKPTYHLSADSPCIDKGIKTDAPLTDMDGETRSSDAVDIGADEYSGI